jgi:hypothetical protein
VKGFDVSGCSPQEQCAVLDTHDILAISDGQHIALVCTFHGNAVHHHGVPIAGEPQQFRELWPGRVPARGLVSEDPAEYLALELAFLVLVQSADRTYPIR